ncbi:MAG: hypothetical protein QCI82_07890 [Candidatus Thermoplasmatota archaeon]|nr:hypothetical protein [Candidatus Thermoplasmatota archaeon]
MKRIKEHTKDVKDRINRIKRGGDHIDLSRVISEIKRVRPSGDRPKETIGETDMFVFECDLCLMKIKEGELTQCPYCGRWVCLKRCYSKDESSCISCESMIRLKRESIQHIKEILSIPDAGTDKIIGEDEKNGKEG